MDPITRRGLVAAGAAATAATTLRAVPRAAAAPAPRAAKARRSKTSVLPDARTVARRHADPADLGVLECAALLQARMLSPQELLGACHARIARRNGGTPSFDGGADVVNAWIRLYDDSTQAAAAAAKRLSRASVRRAGHAAPLLCGIPIGVKDLYAVKGKPLTASSHVLDGNVAAGDSTVWARLRYAGMVLVGHTHTHEFAAGASTDQVGNPWDTSRTPAGSSGGSGAALSSRMVPAATGTDTGGSLRMPSSVCGTSTIKPTIGRVSTHGVIPLGFTLDHAGPMARSIADASLLLSAMAGPDPRDPGTAAFAPPAGGLFPTQPGRGARPLTGTRLGVPRARIAGAGVEPGVAACFEGVLAECRSLGAEVVDVVLPDSASSATTALLEIEVPEFLLYHQQFADRITRYRPALQEFFAASTTPVPAEKYLEAQRARTRLVEDLNALYAAQRLDAIIEPTTPIVAPKRNGGEGNLLLTAALAIAALTGLWDVTGMPVVAIPAGLTPDTALPCGFSLIGCAGEEERLLQMGIDLQAHYPHHELAPKGLA